MSFIGMSEADARKAIKRLVTDYYFAFKRDDIFQKGDRINYAGRVFDEKEMISLTDAMLDFWLTSGHFSAAFESDFAGFLGVKYAHLVNSGSSANLIAFSVLTSLELGERRIVPGDEIITVAAAFPTTVAPIIQCGAIPVFVDITIPQYNINTDMLENAYSAKTKAVFLAHTLGNPFDIKTVKEFCDRHQLWLIEDNCDALGSEFLLDGENGYTGTFGDLATGSFYPPHHITLGEGGVVVTNNPLLNRLILSYRDWGRDCICSSGEDNHCGRRYEGQFGELPAGYDHKYVYSHFGYNLKITDMQAAIGCEQLRKLPDFIEKRKHNWNRLRDNLVQIEDKVILPEKEKNSNPSWFGFLISIREKTGIKRNDVIQFLENRNIQTRLLFSGNIIKHPCFDGIRGTKAYRVVGNLQNTDFVMNNSFWVGVYPGMNDEMIDYMSECIIEAVCEK